MRDRVVTLQGVHRNTRTEPALAILACWPIAGPSLILVTNVLVPRFSWMPVHPGTLAVYGVFALALAGSVRLAVQRLTPAVAGIIITLVLAFAAMIILDHDHRNYYLSVAAGCLGLAVPWLIVANAINQHSQFLRYLHIAAGVILLAGAVRLYLPDPLGLAAASYSQYAGYQVLPASLIFADTFLHRRSLRSGLLAVAALLLLIGAGARGPLFAFLLYMVACAVLALRRRPLTAVVITASGLVAAVWLNVLAPKILTSLARLFAAQGLSTRAVDRLVAGSFIEDRTREVLANHSWDLIFTHPLTGVGLARDRLLIAVDMAEHDPKMIHGWYPHNIFLELLVQWGVLVGGFLILMTALLVFRGLAHDIDKPRQRVVLIFVGIGLWPLLVSGSYLTSPHFFALIGFCLASRRSSSRYQDTRPRPRPAAD